VGAPVCVGGLSQAPAPNHGSQQEDPNDQDSRSARLVVEGVELSRQRVTKLTAKTVLDMNAILAVVSRHNTMCTGRMFGLTVSRSDDARPPFVFSGLRSSWFDSTPVAWPSLCGFIEASALISRS
jgi:hypothetical protein